MTWIGGLRANKADGRYAFVAPYLPLTDCRCEMEL
jgi:hypothetical protein